MHTPHTLQNFDKDLEQLRELVLKMGDLVRQEIEQGVQALLRGRTEIAEELIANDRETDSLQADLEALTTRVLARQNAVAQDLREILAAERIGIHLERIGDYAKNTVRRLLALKRPIPTDVSAQLYWLKERMLAMLDNVLQAFRERDAERANTAWASDEELDHLYKRIFEELLAHMTRDPDSIADSIHLLLVAKGLERAGDHATDIAEAIYHMVTGKPIQGQRPKVDSIVF